MFKNHQYHSFNEIIVNKIAKISKKKKINCNQKKKLLKIIGEDIETIH